MEVLWVCLTLFYESMFSLQQEVNADISSPVSLNVIGQLVQGSPTREEITTVLILTPD